MKIARSIKYQPMTADDVLRVIVDDHRHQCEYDPEADPEAQLNFDTKVEEWRLDCDLIEWKELGNWLNIRFKVDFGEGQWWNVLEPANSKTLKDVCCLIASKARSPYIDTINIFGKDCRQAKAFLIIRDILEKAGANVTDLRPSSKLAPYAREWTGVFLVEIVKLAPGALAPVDIKSPFYNRCIALFGGGLLSGLILLGVGFEKLGLISLLLGILGYIGTWIGSRLKPKSVTFGALDTFRDLAEVVTSHNQRS